VGIDLSIERIETRVAVGFFRHDARERGVDLLT